MPFPSVEFQLNNGLYTKARQDDVSALTTATNVDYFTVAGGVGKVSGTERRSNTSSGTVKSIHSHEGYFGTTLFRLALALFGTTLREIASDQTLLSIKTGLTSEPLFSVSAQDRVHFASASNTPFKVTTGNVESPWGITPPSTTITATKGATGNVPSGGHRYVATFVSTYGKESNRSDPSSTVLSTGSVVALTNIPVSADTQVTSRKIYRDDQGDGLYRLVATIADNVTTTYSDNLSNADISTTTAPEAGSGVDNSPPENMAFVAPFDAYIFGVLASDRNTLVWSEANQPEYFPTLNTRTFNTQITALSPILGGLLVFGGDWMVAVTGGEGGSRTLAFNEVNPELGCVGPRAVCRVKQSIFLIHDDGPYITTNGTDGWYLGAQIRDLIDDLDSSTFASSFVVHDRTRFRVLWFVNDQCFVYNYGNLGTGKVSDDGQGVDPLDLRLGKWSTISFPGATTIPQCAAVVESSADTPEIWLGTTGSIVYRFNDSATSFAVGSAQSAISATIESTYEKLLEGPDRHGMLRYLIIKGSGDAASTWTATLTTAHDAGGSSIRSLSKSVTVGPGVTSKKYSLPRGYQGAYCKLQLTNSAVGETGVIESARVHFVPRPARGER